MLEWVSAILLIAVSYALLRFGLWLLKIHHSSHEQYVDAARAFYVEANNLLQRDDLSKGDIEFIDDMASTINNPRAAFLFLEFLKKKSKPSRRPKASLSPLSDHLKNEHFNLNYLWFTAVTANSPFVGSLVRVTIAQQNIPNAVRETSHKANVMHQENHNGRLAHA
ncbi:hypothetical protein GCM10011491_31030 [Brucella endophytica]|uniref:Uncharacterized protein n=1 Tax=Brucella endophytica TaxID=1963359 RepID=A0A916SJF8_9HYPH|nr:hypothetical protein [Brucella endophytica]GGB00635.1 hypothetical protein GCM10011491_31030 [Brucella endophytica]